MSMQRLPFTRRAAALARLTITSIGALGLTHAALAQAPVSQSLPSTAAPARASFRLADVRLKGVAAMDEKQLHRLVAPYLGREVPARIPGKGKLKVIEAAPGSYARVRADGR